MILYHGTYTDIQSIDLDKSIPYKDVGRGFYLTDLLDQAGKMAAKKATLYKGTAIVLCYEFNEKLLSATSLKVKIFEKPDREWAEFIFKNRNRRLSFKHQFDIVVGPIANDGVAYLLDRYDEGSLTLDDLAKELKFSKLNNQYFFGSERAIKYLRRL